MKGYFTFFTCLFFSVKLLATAQVPDYLITEKDTVKLHSNPLEIYFKVHPLPDNLITSISSGNWRGYIAYFKFKDNKLVVENIYKEFYPEKKADLHAYSLVSIYKDVFGEIQNFPCDFYNGLLICPYGKQLQYVHMGYSSVYEYYRLFEIRSGIQIKSKDLFGDEFYKFKKDYFSYFKTTEEYKQKAEEFRKITSDMELNFVDAFSEKKNKKNKKNKKENKYLKQKEAEFRAEKELDSFMFLFLDEYVKTIDIPNKQ
ncbi:hypothetical protein [Flavobacterium sp.]|jgi:hypothetical protein|uniref:hypothetical protein n=1 Tax=Flavobacterium sp. TaxID=239 RepID=UPI0037C08D32